MDTWEAIQHEAMLAVVAPDDAAWLRRVFRIYSRTFATPLHLVPELPLDDVLLAVYEELFEGMDEGDRLERIEWLLMTPKEREEHKDAETTLGKRDEDFLDQLNQQVAKGEEIQRKPGQVPQPQDTSKLARLVERAKARAAKVAGVQLPGRKPTPQPAKEPKQPATLGDLPEIRMDFGKTGNLGNKDWSDLDPLAPPRKVKKP